jgi:hypothetical protein
MAKETKVESADVINVESTIKEKNGPTQRMYVGPNLFTRGILQYQVFIGELPKEAQDFAKEREEAIEKLFVPVDSNIGQVINDTNLPGSLMNIYFEKVKSAYAQEVNEYGI